jgi:glycosyltransferase involved in cell wall biosynthesis
MKILLVAIPNHHFFQWVKQLKDSGFEVYWFDITDGAGFVEKISWVTQYNGWKLKLDYPFRYKIKKSIPRIYPILEKFTTNKVENVFEKLVSEIKPDLIHCFEMQLAGLPIISVMQKNAIPFIYSSWGSDLFDYENLGVSKSDAKTFLKRVDFLITDCLRDFEIAKTLGFQNKFLGVFPGNGGINIEKQFIQKIENRNLIAIKGYQDGVGNALAVLKAIEISSISDAFSFLIFSADKSVVKYIDNSEFFKSKNKEIHSRNAFISNQLLLQKFGECLIYIGNSISDGMPNTLLEAMGMGVFPIQSNPGNVTEEVISNGINGFLIQDPNDSEEIATHIQNALADLLLLDIAKKYNINFIEQNYNRINLKDKIVSLYLGIAEI